jgi:HEAT repeat protein
MSTTNDVEHILQKLRTDYSSLSGRETVSFWKKTIDALVHPGKSAVMPLIMRVGDRDRVVRKAAVQALGKLADSRSVEPLITALRDRNHSVRRAAAEALGHLSFPQASAPLARMLHDEDAQVRTTAAYALTSNDWQPGEESQRVLLVETLEAVLRDKNHRDRSKAVVALGTIGDQRAMNALLLALRDQDGPVWYVAAITIAAYGTTALSPLLALLGEETSNGWAGVTCALGKIGNSRAVEPLLAVLHTGDPKARVNAIEALGEIRDPRAINSLLASLQDANDRIRQVTVDALGNMEDPRVIEPLFSMLQDPLFSIRQRCARLLARLGWHPEDQAQHVLLLVAEGDWEQAARQGAAAVGSLLRLRGDPEVAGHVIQALSTLLEQHAASIPLEDLHTMTMLSNLQYIRRPDDWGCEEEPLDCTSLQERARELLAERWYQTGNHVPDNDE